MEYLKELTKFMGGSSVVGSPCSDFEFIEIIRLGLPSKVIQCVVKSSSVSEDVICKSLRISKRTAARRKANASTLKPSESELIYRFSKVIVTATDILGNRVKAREWLMTGNHAMNGARPIDLLDTGIGFEDVMNLLHRIEFGVYS
ncbi:MAG: antitoxin Xre/MbcA/ParS toxin-binding domain-containing protein [Pirellulaceae bacterium]|nr:antitoxin Xre/MbcA/ParS toxin-binding domain-containing protein [Pirellulaceae bacterium]